MTHDVPAAPPSVLQAKLQAWLVNLLTVVVEAYDLGAALGRGARVAVNGDVLTPDVLYVPNQARQSVKADAIYGAPALAIDVLHSQVSEAERAALRQRYASAHVLEYWQVEADKGCGYFYQADAYWHYDPISPDGGGIYYSAAIIQLAFPANWLRKQPSLIEMMAWWGLVEVEDGEE